MNNKVNLPCSLETRISKKGTEYQVLIIKLTDSLEKQVFLEPAELEIIRLKNSK